MQVVGHDNITKCGSRVFSVYETYTIAYNLFKGIHFQQMIPFVAGSCHKETILFKKLILATKAHKSEANKNLKSPEEHRLCRQVERPDGTVRYPITLQGGLIASAKRPWMVFRQGVIYNSLICPHQLPIHIINKSPICHIHTSRCRIVSSEIPIA